jgi:hypothetical protein
MQLRFPKFPLVVSVAVVSFILVFAVVMMSRSQPHTEAAWRPANTILTPTFVERVIASNYQSENRLSPKFVEVLPIGERNSKTFYVFRFDTPALCGKAGCLHTVYNEQGVRVLSLLLNKNKPTDSEIISASENIRNNYPCLLVNQVVPSGVEQTEFCLSGSSLLRVNSTTSIPEEMETPAVENTQEPKTPKNNRNKNRKNDEN